MIATMAKEIEELLLEKIEPDLWGYLQEHKWINGATDDDIQSFEEEWGVKLPENFKALYRYRDGGYEGSDTRPFNFLYTSYRTGCVAPFCMLSLDRMWEGKVDSYAFDDKMMKDDDFYTEKDIEKLDKRIKPFISNDKWFPFAYSDSLLLMLDFDPSEEGTYGQIIAYVHDPDFIYYVCKDIKELLQDTINNLKKADFVMWT